MLRIVNSVDNWGDANKAGLLKVKMVLRALIIVHCVVYVVKIQMLEQVSLSSSIVIKTYMENIF